MWFTCSAVWIFQHDVRQWHNNVRINRVDMLIAMARRTMSRAIVWVWIYEVPVEISGQLSMWIEYVSIYGQVFHTFILTSVWPMMLSWNDKVYDFKRWIWIELSVIDLIFWLVLILLVFIVLWKTSPCYARYWFFTPKWCVQFLFWTQYHQVILSLPWSHFKIL